jgi:hypothetical protein
MLDHLKNALAVFIMFTGVTIAFVIGAGFAMFCFAVVAHAQGLPLNREPGPTYRFTAATPAPFYTASLPRINFIDRGRKESIRYALSDD